MSQSDPDLFKSYVATLSACKSRAEWLAGADRYPGDAAGDNGVVPAGDSASDYLTTLCQGQPAPPACTG